MRKQLDTTRMKNELEASAFFGSGGYPQKSASVQAVEPKTVPVLPQKAAQKTAQQAAQKVERSFEQLSKRLNNDEIEALAFKLRKSPKSKLNTEIPLEWKQKFDDIAYRLGVGKYELLMYIVGAFLGEVEVGEGIQA